MKISGQWYWDGGRCRVWGQSAGGGFGILDLANFAILPKVQITKNEKSSGFHRNLLYKLTFHWERHLIICQTRTVDNNHDDDDDIVGDSLIKTKSDIIIF